MANSFFVPFNHQPDSITHHSAPVTLGGDEYARLTLRPYEELDDNAIQGDQGITIDGTLVIPQTYWVSNDYDNGEDFIIDVNGTLRLITSLTGTGNIRIDHRINNSVKATNTPTWTLKGFTSSVNVSAGDRVYMNSTSTNQWIKAILIPFEPLPTEIWLPPSTVISSGDGSIVRPYTLERYNTYS